MGVVVGVLELGVTACDLKLNLFGVLTFVWAWLKLEGGGVSMLPLGTEFKRPEGELMDEFRRYWLLVGGVGGWNKALVLGRGLGNRG